jgi:simple sugar transport system permease protein
MLNYVALQMASYVVNGPWKDPLAVEPYTSLLSSSAQLPIILYGTRLHAGIILGIVAAMLVYILLWRTTLGYRLLAVGASNNAARYGGIPTAPYLVLAMLFSGGLAGLAGYGEVAGLHHRMLLNISPEYGYTAIAVALMGRLHPAGIVVTAFLFAASL